MRGSQGNDAMMPGGEERLVADGQRVDMASTCSEFIYSVRLDHAARLLQRRASLGGRPAS